MLLLLLLPYLGSKYLRPAFQTCVVTPPPIAPVVLPQRRAVVPHSAPLSFSGCPVLVVSCGWAASNLASSSIYCGCSTTQLF